MTIEELIQRIKTLPTDQAKVQLRRYMLAEIVGDDKPGRVLENRFKRKLRRYVLDL